MADLERTLAELRADFNALSAQNTRLEAEVLELRQGLGQALPPNSGANAYESGSGPTDPGERLIGRRAMFAAAAGAAGGILLAQATPAAATDGNPVLLGASNDSSGQTIVSTSGATGLYGSTINPNGVGTRGDGGTYGVYGYTPTAVGTNYGVYGVTNSPAGYGVYSAGRFKANGRSFLAAPDSAPASADLDNGSISFFLNETKKQLKIKVKYSNGKMTTATIALS
jgi:hypothetical protein